MEAYNEKNSEKVEQSLIHYFAGVYNKALKMAELKFILLLGNALGWTATFYALFISIFNVDVFTRSVLGVLSMAFVVVKIVAAALSTYRKHRFEMFEIKNQLNIAKEKELDLRERELLIYDRETELIKNHKT